MDGVNYCVWCGFKLTSDDKFCPNCGEKIEELSKYASSISISKNVDEINRLKKEFENTEFRARNLIEKRFSNSEVTFNKFIGELNQINLVFYGEADSALDLVEYASDFTKKVENKLKNKIKNMKKLLKQLNDLIDEIILNLDNGETSADLEYLYNDIDELINSIKYYK